MVDRFTPDFRVEIDGIDRTRNVWEYLESIQYDDAESGESDSLNLIVANDPPFTIPRPGAEVKFWLGWKESGLKFFGTFVVDSSSIELNPAKMSISAKSANFNSSAKGSKDEKERRDREWENVTLADIAAKIAAEHGGNSKVEVDVHYPHIAQTGESNLSFLRRLSAEMGATFAVKDNTILIYPPDKGSRPAATLVYSESVSGSFTAKAREEYSETEAKWWDKREAREKKVSAQRKQKDKWGNSAGSGMARNGPGTKHITKKRYHSASEAKTAADNHMILHERGEFEADLTLPGDPNLVAGAEITLERFRPENINGRYLAKTVSHSVTKSGWTTRITLESI